MTAPTVINNDYTLGSGECSIAKFQSSVSKLAAGFRYFGNTPSLSFTTDVTYLDHFDADHGLKVKDQNVALTVVQTISLGCDNIDMENLALLIFGTKNTITTTSATVAAEHIDAVIPGLTYQLGQTTSNPPGVRGLDVVSAGHYATVTDDAGSPASFTEDDWTVDPDRGTIYIKTADEGGSIDAATNLRVTYKTLAASHYRVVSGQTPIEGAFKFTSFNAVGSQKDYFFPWVKITPDGDYSLKGDEWQVMNFKMEVLKISGRASIYVDGEVFV